MLLEGLFLPMTTPFYGDGRLYLRKLEHNAERYSRTLAAGLAVLTPVGEPARLSDEEQGLALKSVAEATAQETVLLADVSRGGVRGVLAMAETAAALQYDVALLRLPTRAGGASVREQRTMAFSVADRSPLPIVLLEEREEALPVELVTELAGHRQIIGLVATASGVEAVQAVLARTAGVGREVTVTPVFEAVTARMLQQRTTSAAVTYIAAESLAAGGTMTLAAPAAEPAIKTRTRRVGFQVLAGRAESSLALLRGGAKGTLLPFGICAPQACHEVLAAWKDDDQALAREKFERVLQAARTIEDTMGVAGLKAAADLNGYFGGSPRLPGLPLLRVEKNEVERLMQSMRN